MLFSVGCTSISDYLTKFSFSGDVANNTSTVRFRVIDVNLDDHRSLDQRVIIDTSTEAGKNFHYEKSYFWGSSKSDAYKKGKVKVIVDSDSCKTWEKEFYINDFYNDKKIVSINIGSINLECKI